MRPATFEYIAPETLDEAVALLSQHAPDAQILAGGQSLIPAMTLRLARPSLVIDIGRIGELAGIEHSGGSVAIGARTTHAAIEASPILTEILPMLPVMARHIGHPAIRNRGTFGGNLAHADPASEWPCALLALDGRVDVIGPSGARTIASDAFFRTYHTTALEPGEIITRIVFSTHYDTLRWSFREFARQRGAFALVLVLACGAQAPDGSIADLRLAIGGCGPSPVVPNVEDAALVGARPDSASISEAAERIARSLDPQGDSSAGADDRRQIARVLIQRALADMFALDIPGGRQ